MGELSVTEEDYVIAVDGGLSYCGLLHVEPDLIIGDCDSMTEQEKLAVEQLQQTVPEKICRLPECKDDTDMLAAIKRGLELGYTDFRIYAATGGRFDHTLANIQGPDIHSKILRIGFSQLVGFQRLGQKNHQQKSSRHHDAHHFHIIPGHSGKASSGPVVEIHDIRVLRKSHHQFRNGRTDVTDHHAADHQHGHAVYLSRHEKYESHGQHSS